MYLLMNKDNIVAEIKESTAARVKLYTLGEVFGKLPYGFKSANNWLEGRQASKHRKHIRDLMEQCGCSTPEGYIRVLHCVSINDTFWVKREDESLKWSDVSLFENEFDETITRIAFEGSGLYGGEFSTTSPEFSIDGAYEKCCVREDSNLYIIKRGTTGYANAGLEPYSEVFTAPIYKHIVGVSTDYKLIKYHGAVASKCRVFTDNARGFASYARMTSGGGNLMEAVEYYESIGYPELFYAMLVADAVCFNSDRHAGNHGVLFDADTLAVLCMAPPFDHNLSLLPYAMESDFPTIDKYIAEQGPRIGDTWINVARTVLDSYTRLRLISLKGYTIPFEGDEEFPKKRVDLMNDLINRQIDLILK